MLWNLDLKLELELVSGQNSGLAPSLVPAIHNLRTDSHFVGQHLSLIGNKMCFTKPFLVEKREKRSTLLEVYTSLNKNLE